MIDCFFFIFFFATGVNTARASMIAEQFETFSANPVNVIEHWKSVDTCLVLKYYFAFWATESVLFDA